jgi:hypothetical protein
MHRAFFYVTVICCFLSFAAFDYAAAQNINIDFGAYYGTPSNAFGAASGQTGVWNTLGNGATPNLLDITGANSGVTATVSSYDDTGRLDSGCGGDLHAFRDDNFFLVREVPGPLI